MPDERVLVVTLRVVALNRSSGVIGLLASVAHVGTGPFPTSLLVRADLRPRFATALRGAL